ncbi:MAG: choice-of-anchor Q domain-containing protein, partial [Candidatus Cloacimonadota bacterium]|nr:choice-of-anchor Q domain-containing protein [Candidatus Cloacimonadota bacterium]
ITQNNSYIDSTIIDGNQNGSVVTFESGEDTTAVLCGFTIQNGSGMPYASSSRGGGIFCYGSNPTVKNCVIKENTAGSGGGICCKSSAIYLSDVIIKNNHVQYNGGGIFFWNDSSANFDSESRCSIFLNYAGAGCELRSNNCNTIDIIVDTFTVMEPKDYFVYPLDNFTFDILNCKVNLLNQDLYVSPDGNDNNSGITPDEPLKTISFALTKIASDSTHPNTIYLANGIYSSSLTGEIFPLNCRSYVSIIGEDEDFSILDGDNLFNIIGCIFDDNHFYIENLTIQNGNCYLGGGIAIQVDSSPTLKNVTLRSNTGTMGGAIYCGHGCIPIFDNVSILNNTARTGGGGFFYQHSSPIFINCKIRENSAVEPEVGGHGGILCQSESNLILMNTELTDNFATVDVSGFSDLSGTGDNPNSYLINCTICNNSPTPRCIALSTDANLTLINCIVRNYSVDEIGFTPGLAPDTVTISYTNIEDSIDAINTNNNGTINWLEGNIDSIPQFVGGDPFSYQLTEGSPCIDAGTPDTTGLNLPLTDLAGNPRIYNDTIDMGAYEWQGGPGIDEPDTSFINKLYLFQNKPNPFTTSTTITFISADYERIKDYKLSIYNAKGQLIKTYNGKRDNFWVKTDIVWDGTDENGNKVSPGVYFYKLSYGKNSVIKKMILVR